MGRHYNLESFENALENLEDSVERLEHLALSSSGRFQTKERQQEETIRFLREECDRLRISGGDDHTKEEWDKLRLMVRSGEDDKKRLLSLLQEREAVITRLCSNLEEYKTHNGQLSFSIKSLDHENKKLQSALQDRSWEDGTTRGSMEEISSLQAILKERDEILKKLYEEREIFAKNLETIIDRFKNLLEEG